MKNKKIFLMLGVLSLVVVGSSVLAYNGYQDSFSERKNTNISSTNTNSKRQGGNFGKKINQRGTKQSGSKVNLDSLESVEITDQIKDGLLLMREEEKLARDIYLELGEIYGTNIFSNIARSEQQHMDAVGSLLDKYNIEDPITTDERGVFTNEELKKLYDELLKTGKNSISDAIQVGIDIEVLDIKDLEELLGSSKEGTDIYQVYTNLLKGSKNHLSAFQRQK